VQGTASLRPAGCGNRNQPAGETNVDYFRGSFFALMFVVGRVEENWRERKQQDLLDRIVTEM
jgi:hypothetical protein